LLSKIALITLFPPLSKAPTSSAAPVLNIELRRNSIMSSEYTETE
jgi:hypothetical protein